MRIDNPADLSGYVPYTGANANVNIGEYDYLGTDLNITGAIYLDDEKNLNLGNSNDFKLYYNGLTNKAYIDVATSNADLYIRANDGGVMKEMIHLDASEPQINFRQATQAQASFQAEANFTVGKQSIFHDSNTQRTSIGYGADNMNPRLVIQHQADRDTPGDDLLHLTYASDTAVNDPARMHVRKGAGTLDSFSNINEESDRIWDLSVDAYHTGWKQSQLMRWESFESDEDIVPGIFRYFQMNTHGELVEVLTIKDNYVGILEPDPGYNLTVSGTAYIAGALNLGGINPSTDNTVLILDGALEVKTDEIDSRVWGSTLADLTNGVDNRLVTAVDTNSLNGEANLTFDGSTLILTGNQTVVGVITADGLTMGLNELITLNSETLKHDGTDFLFSDSIKCGGASAGQSIIASGLVVNEDGGATAADDLRAETNLVSNAFVVDASADEVLINTVLKLLTIKSGATQVGAGAAASEIWKTASHATLPDNVLLIGV